MKRYKSDIPNLHIMGDINFDNGAKDRIELGKFDESGYLETDNIMLISRLAQLGYQPIAEVTESIINPTVEQSQETKTYTCKQCGFTTDSKGKLAAHYKKEHPKPKK